MKKLVLFSLVLLSFSFSAEAGNKKKKCEASCTPKASTDSIAQKIAINLGDYNTAIVFAYQNLADDPTNLDKTFDLARLYYMAQNHQLSLNVCASILNQDSINLKTMELAAMNFKGLKDNKSAAGMYSLMAKRLNNPKYLYQAAVAQFENKDYDACLNTLNAIISSKKTSEISIEMSRYNAAKQLVKEEINIVAAAHNIAGYIALQGKDPKNARVHFTKALTIEPSFVLAENNLKEVLVLETQMQKPQPEKQ